MSKPTRLVDAHMHLWDLDHLRYPWLSPPFTDEGINGDVSSIASTYRFEDYLNEVAAWPVAGVVHIEAGAHPGDALAETHWLEASLSRAGLPFAIIAFAPLNAPDVERTLAMHCEHPHVRGIRHIANWHPEPRYSYTRSDLLQDPAWQRGVALLASYGLSFDLQIYPGQMKDAAVLAAKHPDLQIVLNHAGMPLHRDNEGLRAWRDGMRLLAAQPNVACKLSGFGIVDHGWTTESIRPFVYEAIEAFGTERCMFASDLPTDRLHAGADRILSAYMTMTSDLSDHERDGLFASNALRIYRPTA
ncbi:amidohydrolase family protein [[Pseudomonas] boreopolis]|uniref:amidohydrolase family protein n=1 Tax=Xanthomonas boreopolis TaxID=86183 RepID=UPI003DA1BEE4